MKLLRFQSGTARERGGGEQYLLKKKSLDPSDMIKYCPVLKFLFLGKMVERVAAEQFQVSWMTHQPWTHSNPASLLVMGWRQH